MEVMNKKLLDNPNTPFSFDNDEECKILLVELGLGNRFSTNPQNLGPNPIQTITHLNHATHWIHAVLFLGHAVAENNGYLILCFPKSRMSMIQFTAAIDQFMKNKGQVAVAKLFPGDSSDN
jgi:hypothetical protein